MTTGNVLNSGGIKEYLSHPVITVRGWNIFGCRSLFRMLVSRLLGSRLGNEDRMYPV